VTNGIGAWADFARSFRGAAAAASIVIKIHLQKPSIHWSILAVGQWRKRNDLCAHASSFCSGFGGVTPAAGKAALSIETEQTAFNPNTGILDMKFIGKFDRTIKAAKLVSRQW
jgi:hypothetical protein